MSAHVRIIELIKQMPSISPLFATSVIHSIIQKQECLDFFLSFDIRLTLKSQIWLEKKNKIVLLCKQCCYGWHYITLQNM